MKWNDTTKFLIPTVLHTSEKKEYPINQLKSIGFVNAFVDDFGLIYSSFDWYKSPNNKYIYLLFKSENKHNFTEQEEIIKKFSNWVDYYDVDKYHIMHVLKVPERHNDDIYKFYLGRFSEFSMDLKNKYTNSFTKGIVFKTDSAREEMCRFYGIDIPKSNEYLSTPNIEKEIYRYNSVTES